MSRPADWWSAAGVSHAYPVGSFPLRSFCGEARWTARAERSNTDPRCEACVEHATSDAPVAAPAVPGRPMSPEVKKAVFRRRWHQRHPV